MKKLLLQSVSIIAMLSITQMHAMWWRKKEPKKSAEVQITWREIVETTDNLARAIKKNDQKEITNIIDSIMRKQIENPIMYRAKSEIGPEYKEIANLVANRKKEKEEEAKIARRPAETKKIKEKVNETGILPADPSGVIADYAVD